jgi:DHA1 family multidrug resistance protein-like MFS transporter
VTGRDRGIRAALFLCVFLYVFTETLLSPFYPQFFGKVFGIEDLAYSAHYVFVCRLTVVACAPLWGLLSRRFEVRRLLLVGQAGAVVFTALLATAETAGQFLALSVALLAFKSSYLLVYSLIVELSGRDGAPAAAGSYGATFHAAIIVSTLVGAFMVGMENPLKLFYWVAAADLLQLALCLRVLRPVSSGRAAPSPSASGAAGGQLGFLLAIGLIIFTFHLANNTIRPYFTAYAERGFGLSLEASGALFLIPSAMAILALPFVKRLAHPERLPRLYAIGLAALAAGLALQGLAGGLASLLAGRVLYGFFLAISQAALELRLFGASGEDRLHLNYGVAVAFQNAGLLAAPLLASSLLGSYGLASPLLAAAVLCAANLVLARLTVFRVAPFTQTHTSPIQGKES